MPDHIIVLVAEDDEPVRLIIPRCYATKASR